MQKKPHIKNRWWCLVHSCICGPLLADDHSDKNLHEQLLKVFDPLYFASSGHQVNQSPAVDCGQFEVSGVCCKRISNTASVIKLLINHYCYISLLRFFFPILVHSHFAFSCSCRRNRWVSRLFEGQFRKKGQFPRELPSVSLPKQQTHALSCAWGESAVEGTLHKSPAAGPQKNHCTERLSRIVVIRWFWCRFFFYFFRSASAPTCQLIMPLRAVATIRTGMFWHQRANRQTVGCLCY